MKRDSLLPHILPPAVFSNFYFQIHLIKIMKQAALAALISGGSFSMYAQSQETFDLVTFIPPKGWTRDISTKDVVRFTGIDNKIKSYCSIIIYRSTASKGTIQQDFESEWEELVVKNYNPETIPQITPLSSENGWSSLSGSALFPYNNGKSTVVLKTMSGFGRCTSMVTLSNSNSFKPTIDEFFASVTIHEPVASTQSNPQTELQPESTAAPSGNGNPSSPVNSIVGTYGNTSHIYIGNFICGYIKVQYLFQPDGIYSFIRKTYDCYSSVIVLEKESGKYQLLDNRLTIVPNEGTTEEWLKEDNFDTYGKFKSHGQRTLEKTTYQVSSHYFPGSGETVIIFQNTQPTVRDGTPSTIAGFHNAWSYSPITKASDVIVLPEVSKK